MNLIKTFQVHILKNVFVTIRYNYVPIQYQFLMIYLLAISSETVPKSVAHIEFYMEAPRQQHKRMAINLRLFAYDRLLYQGFCENQRIYSSVITIPITK